MTLRRARQHAALDRITTLDLKRVDAQHGNIRGIRHILHETFFKTFSTYNVSGVKSRRRESQRFNDCCVRDTQLQADFVATKHLIFHHSLQ